jgi:hypothetical protein
MSMRRMRVELNLQAKKRIRYQDFLLTPFKKPFPVRIINHDHLIRGFGKRIRAYRVPLLDEHSGVAYTGQIIKEKIDHKKNCPILATGEPGVGKSTCISKIARYIDPGFGVKNIGFTLDQFNSVFREIPRGIPHKLYSQADMDESAFAAYTDERLQTTQTRLAKNLIISRIHQKIVWFGAPKAKLVNLRVRNLATVWIDVSEPDYDLQGYAEVHLPPPRKQSKYATGKYWEPSYAFIFKAEKGPFWEEYEKAKLDFIENALDNENYPDKRITVDRLKYLDELAGHPLTDAERGKVFGVTGNRICQIRHETPAN